MSNCANRQWIRRHRAPLAALLLHFMLAAMYSISFPVLEGSDEAAHFFFARHIALNAAIPDVRFEEGLWAQEATQAPLFYMSAALPLLLIDSADAESYVAQRNSLVNLGDGSRPGNKNLYLHDPNREGWPWQRTALAVHVGRLVSALYGAVAVWATYKLVRYLSSRAAALACLFVALLPQAIWASASVTNESASAAMAALALWMLVRAHSRPSAQNFALVGLSLGLATLAKLPGLILAGYVLGLVSLYAVRNGARAFAQRIGIATLAFVGVAGPWLAMNYLRYGDITALSAHLMVMGNGSGSLINLQTIQRLMESGLFNRVPAYSIAIISSLWGVFGVHNILAPAWVYSFFNILFLVGVLGFCARAAQAMISERSLWHVWMAGWLVLHFATLLLWAGRSGGVAGRLLFPALPVIAFVCADGWYFVVRAVGRRLVARAAQAVLPASLGVFAVAAPFWLIMPAYTIPLVVADLPATAVPLNLHYGDLELIGLETAPRLRAGDAMDVVFYWRLTRSTTDEYVLFPRLLDTRLTPVAGTNSLPGWGNWPVEFWTPGLIYADRYRLPVAADAARPGLGRLILSVEAERIVQPPTDANGVQFDPLIPLASVALPPRPTKIEPPTPLATFGDAAALIEAHFPAETRAGDSLAIRLVWQSLRAADSDWQRFLHFDDGNRAQPHLVAQTDETPAGGYGLLWWETDEVIPDDSVLHLPPDLPPGDYALWVGFADPDGLRVRIVGGDNVDGRLYLGKVAVK